MDKKLIEELAKRNDAYLRKAMNAGFDKGAVVYDEWAQFLCDASQKLQLLASNLERLAESNPKQKTFILREARTLKEFSQRYMQSYIDFEQLQRNGTYPTNFEDINQLTEELEW